MITQWSNGEVMLIVRSERWMDAKTAAYRWYARLPKDPKAAERPLLYQELPERPWRELLADPSDTHVLNVRWKGSAPNQELVVVEYARSKAVEILFIINGEDVPVVADCARPLSEAKHLALDISRNTSRPFDAWEVRDECGLLVDGSTTPDALSLPDHARLFVTLNVGAGGEAISEDTYATYARVTYARVIDSDGDGPPEPELREVADEK